MAVGFSVGLAVVGSDVGASVGDNVGDNVEGAAVEGADVATFAVATTFTTRTLGGVMTVASRVQLCDVAPITFWSSAPALLHPRQNTDPSAAAYFPRGQV